MQEIKEIFEKLGKADNEMTSYPWWVIVEPRQNMSMDAVLVGMNITGPFFDRESAEKFFHKTRYNFSDKAVVWCASGTDSKDWRKIYNYAKESQESGVRSKELGVKSKTTEHTEDTKKSEVEK